MGVLPQWPHSVLHGLPCQIEQPARGLECVIDGIDIQVALDLGHFNDVLAPQ